MNKELLEELADKLSMGEIRIQDILAIAIEVTEELHFFFATGQDELRVAIDLMYRAKQLINKADDKENSGE